MINFLSHPLLLFVARIVVGAVFLYAGATKIANPEDFAQAILRYDLLPLSFINIKAILLPWLETIVGLFLIFGVRVRASAAISAILLLVFILAVGISIARGLDISCGCTSSGGTPVGMGKIAENIGLLILSLLLTRPSYMPLSAEKNFTLQQ